MTGGDADEGDGGAIYNSFGSVYITDSTLTGNTATRGGAIYTAGDSFGYGGELASMYLNDVDVTDNTAVDGGGIYNLFDHVELYNGTVVSGNTATNNGGGVYTRGQGGGQPSTLYVYNDSEVSNNSADNNGGGIYAENDHVELWNGAVVSGNIAGNAGGGVYTFSDGFFGPGETLFVQDTSITGNTAVHGGGIYNIGDSIYLYNSTLDSNSAIGTNGTGSADGLGGGIYSRSNAFGFGFVNIQNTTVAGNLARAGRGVTGAPGDGYGGGIYTESGHLTIFGSTVSGNSALQTLDGQGEAEGGGVWSSADSLNATNSTISGNNSEGTGGGIYVGGVGGTGHSLQFVTITANVATDGGGIYHDDSADMSISATIIAGNSSNDMVGTFTGSDNLIGGAPLLGPLRNNFGPTQTHALLPGSPAINGATGFSRFSDQRELRTFGIADIGAFEVVLDFGDAPATFPVTLANNGARHEIGSLFLGDSIDSDGDGQPSNPGFANLDDDFGFPDDEDGISFVAAVGGFSGRVEVTSSGTGFLSAWMDLNGNGAWESSERIIGDFVVTAGLNVVDFNLPGLPGVSDITAITRFRLSSVAGLSPAGAAPDGEVEDYALRVEGVTLPDGTSGGFTFTTVTPPFIRRWFDPEVAVGYEYTVNPGGDNFVAVELVSGYGDDLFTLEFTDASGLAQSVTIGAFTSFNFETDGATPGGVSFFRITGIEPSAGLDPDDPEAFPTGLSFGDADGNGEAIVNFTMVPLATPIAENDDYEVDEDHVLNLNFLETSVLENDTDRNDDELTARLISGPTNGLLDFNDDGTFVYTPNENFNGTDAFVYVANDGLGDSDPATVTITVNPVNDAPVAVDDEVATDEDTSVVLDLLGNDSDVDGDDLDVIIVLSPSNGTLIEDDGLLVYVPNANFYGEDSFTYVASDGELESEIATVTITVEPVNDAPVAEDDEVTTDEDTSVVLDLLGNDSDIDDDDLSVVIVTQPASGTVVVAGDGTLTYTPNLNFHGTDTFTYVASDADLESEPATVTITVQPVNDAPVASNDAAETDEDNPVTIGVLTNDVDVDGDDLTPQIVAAPANGTAAVNPNSTITYTPNAGFSGTDTFTYLVNDGHADSNVATVTITVEPDAGGPTVEVIADPLNPARRALQVTGTSGNDAIVFARHRNGGVQVWINGASHGIHPGIHVVIAHGLAGDDQITVHSRMRIDARLYGNDGNDRLRAGLFGINILDGGNGNDRLQASTFGSTVMIGGNGRDQLIGGLSSRDILIGGAENDSLYGGLLGQSILIGGTTSFDSNAAALSAIQAEWNSNNSFNRRVRNLTNGGGLNGNKILAIGNTVQGDNAIDELFGGLFNDWFFKLDQDRLRNVWFNDFVSR